VIVRPFCEFLQVGARRFAEERDLRSQFVRVAIRNLASTELQVDVCAGLTQPDRPLRSPKLREAEFRLEHFHDNVEMCNAESIGGIVQFHHRSSLPNRVDLPKIAVLGEAKLLKCRAILCVGNHVDLRGFEPMAIAIGGQAYFAFANGMARFASTPVVPEGTSVGALTALLRHSRMQELAARLLRGEVAECRSQSTLPSRGQG
jgi:hypothetical protein